MNEILFQAGGPLPGRSPCYIPREADQKAALHLRRMEYISITEPRQQGKTSLVNQLMDRFSSQGYIFATRDLMAARSSAHTVTDWYSSLGDWLLHQLSFFPYNHYPALPTSSATWEAFLLNIAERASLSGQRAVIVLDEIGAMPAAWATDFFSILRSVYTSRQSISAWQYLTFIIAGAFNPRDLIQDPTISDFNIAQRIVLNDFTLSEIKQLVTRLQQPDEITDALAARIHYWTSGQPYLCQWLCLDIAEHEKLPPANPDIVDEAVNRLFNSDMHYLLRIKRIFAEPDLLVYIRSLTDQQRTRLSAGLNDKHFRLAHIYGVIKADADGMCQIRNRLCERAMQEFDTSSVKGQSSSLQSQHGFLYDVFISYSHRDSDWVHNILLPRLKREGLRICIDHLDFEIGTPSIVNMEKAVAHSHKTLLILTPNWVASEWTSFESLLLQTKDPINIQRRILPVMVQPCTLPDRLQIFTYLDVTKPAELDFQMQRLVESISSS